MLHPTPQLADAGNVTVTRRALLVLTALVAGVLSLGAAPAGAAEQSVFPYGDAPFYGSTGTVQLNNPVVGMAPYRTAGDPTHDGYWLAAREGRVFTFGYAPNYGSTASPTAHPVVGIAASSNGGGYWLATTDGGIFSFGAATFYGSLGAINLNQPIVGIAATPSGHGYWLVASDGGIFSFGDARFFGSTGAIKLNQPIVGMASTPSGSGYWMVASDGGVFTFGNAPFIGSHGGGGLTEPVVGVVSSRSGNGYSLVTTGHLSPSKTSLPAERVIAPGTYKVSALGPVFPGTYRAQYATAGCHWQRDGASGPLVSVTSSDRQIVTIKSGDTGFTTSGCAPFTSDLFPTTRSQYGPFGDGDWLVHIDVGPGDWKTTGGPSCQWALVGDFSGDDAARHSSGTGENGATVHIDSADTGFASSGCGTWTPVGSSPPSAPVAP